MRYGKLLAAFALFAESSIAGNTCTWKSDSLTTSSDWTAATNYVEGVAPVVGNGDTVVIPESKSVFLYGDDSASCAVVTGGLARIQMNGKRRDGKGSEFIVVVDEEDGVLDIGCPVSDIQSDHNRGMIIKRGDGEVYLTSTASLKDYCTSITVEAGTLHLPTNIAGECSYSVFSVSSNATLHIACGPNKPQTVCVSVSGGGIVTNSYGNTDNRLVVQGSGSVSDFHGIMAYGVRLIQKGGYIKLSNPLSNMYYNPTARNNSGSGADSGYGVIEFSSISDSGELSSVGRGDALIFGISGGAFLYSGTGDVTDRGLYFQYPLEGPGFVSGGPHGGLFFDENSIWNFAWTSSEQVKGMTGLFLDGDGEEPCGMAGTISQVVANGVTNRLHLTKTGAGTWYLADGGERTGLGGIDVVEGTLRFDSLEEKGTDCALGTAVDCHTNYCGAYDASARTDYAFSLGGNGTEGTLEYTGSGGAWCTTRPAALKGNARFSNIGSAPFRFANVYPLVPGAKTLTLDGAGTGENVIADVRDTSDAPISIVKEGSGTWMLSNTNAALHGSISVKEGTLLLRSPAGRYSWYLWTIKGVLHPEKVNDVRPTEFCFFHTNDYMRVNAGIAACSDYAAIEPGQAAFMTRKDCNGNLAELFDGEFLGDDKFYGTVSGKVPDLADPETAMPILMRISEDAPVIGSYDFACKYGVEQSGIIGKTNLYGVDPKAWTLHGSVDGLHWDLLHRIDDSTDRNCGMPVGLYANRFYKAQSNQPYAMTCSTNSQQIASFAVAEENVLANVTGVSVASGATLAAVGEPLVVSALEINAAGAGTMSNFTFAASGSLNVVLSSEVGPDGIRLPGTYVDVTGLENVADWTVSVNGEPEEKRRVAFRDGSLHLLPRGLVFIVR